MTTNLKRAWQTSHNVSRQRYRGLFGQTVCLKLHYVVWEDILIEKDRA